MTAHLDKSLDDLISEQRSSRPKSTVQARRADERPRDDRKSSGYRSRGRPQQEERPAPRGGSNYWQHDDRADDANHRQHSKGPPPPGQRWQRGQAPPGAHRSRAAEPEPIVTTADGWEEVAQEEPRRQQRGGNGSSYYNERPGRAGGGGGGGGGVGPQRRRGGVWDRLGQPNDHQENGYGRQQRESGKREEYDPVQEDARPKRPAYYDAHDHRDDPRASRGVRRFEPYSRGGGFGGRRGRGGRMGGFKWKHDLYETAAAAAAAADEAGEVEVEEGAVEQQQGDDAAEMQE